MVGNVIQPNGVSGGEVYSTAETVIGTWIDGKPLYRKCYQITHLPNSSSLDIPHGLSNVKIVRIYGYSYTSAYTLSLPYVSTSSLSGNISLIVMNSNITIGCGVDRSSESGIAILEYTKNS